MSHELAIVGMAGRFPGADTLRKFWENLCLGVESIRPFSDQELLAKGVPHRDVDAPNFVKAGAILDDVDQFAASFFGFSPREAELMDPQHRIFLECAWEALEHAGYNHENSDELIGVYAGTSLSSYLLFNLLENSHIRNAQDTFPIMVGNDKDFLSTRVSYHLNLRGPSIDIQTGCSTSLVAFHLACEAVLSYQCDLALAGGVSVNVPQRTGYYYHPGGVVSQDGHCRTFDARAQGTVFGSGVGVVVIKRLAEALEDGDTIYAVAKGSAINNDGSSKVGYTAPSVEGQAEVIARAHAIAEVSSETVTYVETHGTATPLGDPVEVEALVKAFRASTQANGFCAVGSVKANIGHLDAAAGVAGLIKTILALYHRKVPPLKHLEKYNEQIEFSDTPFYISTELMDWGSAAIPRRAGVSSFGIGGTNAHVVLEEGPPAQASAPESASQILVLSAKTETALEVMIGNLARHLRAAPDQSIADVAYTLQLGRKPFQHRSALVCTSCDDAAKVLEGESPERLRRSVAPLDTRSVAFLFPGQGSQYVHMARDLYAEEQVFRQHIDQCCNLLAPSIDLDLRTLLFDDSYGPPEADLLAQTQVAQPALFAVEYALAQLWMHWGVRPEAMLGHSIGEYVAACLAGVFSLEDALALVALRGRMMQQVPGGAMLAVVVTEAEVEPLVTNHELSLAACNTPRQCVVSGPVKAINGLVEVLDQRDIAWSRLATSHAFHSSMMDAILEPFRQHVSRVKLNAPALPFVSNLTGTWISAGQATDPGYWAQHARQTVRFNDGLGVLLEESARVLLEVGPGRTLSSLARKHPARSGQQIVLPSLNHGRHGVPDTEFVRTTLGRLWAAGVKVDWSALHGTGRRRRIPLPTYPFERQRYWLDPQQRIDSGAAVRPELGDWFYTPIWKRTLPPAPSQAGNGKAVDSRWLVFNDGSEAAATLIRRLEETGHRITSVSVGAQFAMARADGYELDPAIPDHYLRLIDAVDAAGCFPDHVLHLWNLEPLDTAASNGLHFKEAQTSGLYSLLYLAQALAPRRDKSVRIWSITTGLHDVTGEEPLIPERASLLGLCDVLPQELRHVSCHNLDLDSRWGASGHALTVEQIVAEITQPHPAPTVALRYQQRWLPTFEPLHLEDRPAVPPPLRSGGVYMIVGGLGAIGLALAEFLAATVKACLVLVRRTPFPNAEQWSDWLGSHSEEDSTSRTIRRLQSLQDLGARVLVACADVADKGQLQAVVDKTLEEFSTLNGVFHAAGHAGESAFRLMKEIDRTTCEQEFRTKAHGLYALESVLAPHRLDILCLISSNASILGGPGLLAYAAAHRFMDAFARSRNRLRGTPWLSTNWDRWLVESEPKDLRSSGVREFAVQPSKATDALRRILTRTISGQVAVSAGDLTARIEQWIGAGNTAAAQDAETKTFHARPTLDVSYVPPDNEIETQMIEIWRTFLGIEQIGVHDNFFDLGGNSLIGAEIVNRVNETLELDLPIVTLFEQPTVSTLVKAIAEQPDQAPGSEPPVYQAQRRRGERRRQLRQKRGNAVDNA